MSNISWNTPRGNIGTIPEAEYFEYQLLANDATASVVRYNVVSGTLPPGMQVNQNSGLLSGVPVVTRNNELSEYQFEFTVRAFNDLGDISDRKFSLIVSGIIPVKITPHVENLGAFYDGLIYSRQLQAVEFSPTSEAKWSVLRGKLPAGLTLSADGLLNGYLNPIYDVASGDPGWDNTSWDTQNWDFSGIFITKTFEFLVQVTDGYSIDRINYFLTVVARSSNIGYTGSGKHRPIMSTPAGAIPAARQQNKYLFKFDAIDFDLDPVSCHLVPVTGDFSLTGLSIDANTGWLSGIISQQTKDIEEYVFRVYATKRDDPSFSSRPATYTLQIFGDLTNIIHWSTNSFLGSIDNGEVSTFQIRAVAQSNRTLYYELEYGDPGQLPAGLKLLPSGLISGQTSFQYFILDRQLEIPTTFDNNSTIFDTEYNFNVVAKDYNNNISSTKTFTIKVNNINPLPYQNLYLNALPSSKQRTEFSSIIENTELFPIEIIYRFDDPYFGKADKIRSLFAAGLTPSELETYAIATQKNHYDKRLFFGEIKTARALDDNFNPLYEVVYIELIDTLSTKNKGTVVGPELETDLSGIIKTPYYTETGAQLEKLMPNSFINMKQRVSDEVGYVNQGALPKWMTSQQENGSILGLVNAAVLAYTVPGAAELVAFRLRSHNIDFGQIEFVADRYHLDTHATKHFNISTQQFLTEAESTFDASLSASELAGVLQATYAVQLPFDEINGRSVLYVQSNGGFDGVIDFSDGDTVIFSKQANYAGYSGSNNGWFRRVIVEGNETLEPIPGYLEQLDNLAVTNQQSGIWKIRISNDIVSLEFYKEVTLGQKVVILGGFDFLNTIFYYNPIIPIGATIPEYSIVDPQTKGEKTIFDNGGTKFFGPRDIYGLPGADAKYIKFPQFGVIKQ